MEYQFRPLGKTCAATGKPFQPGERCRSVLTEQKGEFVRLDYSEAEWKGLPQGAIGDWLCLVPRSELQQVKKVDTEAMFKLFEQLVEQPNLMQEKLAYVLALFLLQKRRLKLDGSRTDGREFLLFSGTRGEGPYEVPDQQLSSEEVAQLQAELNQQLLT